MINSSLPTAQREEAPITDGATAVFDLNALRNWLQTHRVNDPDPLTGRTVLHSAAAQGRDDVVRHLLTIGADLRATDDEQQTRTCRCRSRSNSSDQLSTAPR